MTSQTKPHSSIELSVSANLNPGDTVLARLAALQKMDITCLRSMWRNLYKTDPPKSMNAQYLIRRLSYRIQELTYGGDSAQTKARLAKGYCNGGKSSNNAPPAGSVLTREYHGVEHQVAVLADGDFQYNGRKFGSLSGIAKEITGMSWSGHDFFGLKPRKSTRKGKTA